MSAFEKKGDILVLMRENVLFEVGSPKTKYGYLRNLHHTKFYIRQI